MIENNEQYEEALRQIEILMRQDSSSSNMELENLTILIEDWEKIHYPISEPSFLDMIEFRFSQKHTKIYIWLHKVMDKLLGENE